ncbi:MAG: type II secretion system F family protein [archaeon]|jgi:pilus assembly protein TadC|nr:type II secretion system F family protein [archaeon]
MIFKIPFTFSSPEILKKKSRFISSRLKHKKTSRLSDYLRNSDASLTREEYLAICIRSFLITFISLYIIFSTLCFFIGASAFCLVALAISLPIAGFMLFSQLMYPKVYSTKKQKDIEKNLIPALEDMLVQLNSGIPLFTILVNISSSGYGELTTEFKRAVKKINSGMPQIDVLEELGEKNISPYFRRTLWQISNGMRAGSDISIIIKESIKSLSEEQIIQIQSYGNKLNPIIMFFMLTAVIMPALAITFFTIIASLVSLPTSISQLVLITLFGAIIFVQIMFLGTIRSLRPTLI